MKKTSVLLADDHTLIRAGLRMVVDAQPDLTVVGEASDGREAVAMAGKLKPDVVVMRSTSPSRHTSGEPRAIVQPELPRENVLPARSLSWPHSRAAFVAPIACCKCSR